MRRIGIAVMVALMLTACASDGATVSAGDSSNPLPTSSIAPNPACPLPAAPPDSCGIADGTAPNPNPAVGAHLIVTGTVTAVTAPRWNQPDGTDWTADYLAHEDGYTIRQAPYRYRLVTVQIDEMVFGTSDARALLHPDGTATVAFYGNGTDTGMEYGMKPGVTPSPACASGVADCTYVDTALRFNNLDGPVAVGDHVIYMLGIETIRMRDQGDNFSALMPMGWRGNFHLEADGRYHNLDPTVSYSREDIDALIAQALALCPATTSQGGNEPQSEAQQSAVAVDDSAAPLESSSPGQCP